MTNDIYRDIFLAFIRVHVLHHAEEKPVYGVWMMNELTKHGYDVSPGTLYPILHRMVKSGYLQSEKQVVNGKTRKYYRITDEGRDLLRQLRPKIDEMIREVSARHPERRDSSASS